MTKRENIHKIRESGGRTEIGSIEDGAILEMIKMGGRVVIIKERSIYEFMLADYIDPDRTNINLPNTIHKLIIDQGAESELVCRTFLTAKTLFSFDFFGDNINIPKALTLSLDFLQEMATLDSEIDGYLKIEEKLMNEYITNKSSSYSIPSIQNVESRCKTIFQKADHIEQILMEIITVFYSDHGLTKQSHFPKFHQVILEEYGESDPFVKFLSTTLDFMKLVRALRNALDHRLDTVKITNFELQTDSTVLTPTIELNHRDSRLDRQALSTFLPVVLLNLVAIFEVTIAYLSDKNSKPTLTAKCVKEIPKDKRKYEYVKYSFWAPLGAEGYYNQ